jgi:hypothetical protein
MAKRAKIEVTKHGDTYVPSISESGRDILVVNCPECMSFDVQIGSETVCTMNEGAFRSVKFGIRSCKCNICGCKFDVKRRFRGKIRVRDMAIFILIGVCLLSLLSLIIGMVADLGAIFIYISLVSFFVSLIMAAGLCDET